MRTLKKTIIFIIMAIILSTGLNAFEIKKTYAQPGTLGEEECLKKGFIFYEDKCYEDHPADLLLRLGEEDAVQVVRGLPEMELEQVIVSVIRTILGWSMLLTIIAIVVAAIYYLKSQGNEEDLNKAKNIIVYLLVGIAIMATAYGIVVGISQFDFFRGTPPPDVTVTE